MPTSCDRNRPTEPAEARDEDQLELRDHRAGDADEQVVEAAVLEVILDPGAADPADAAVDDDDLAMIDVSEPGEVPARGAPGAERAGRRPHLCRAHDAHFDTGGGETLVLFHESRARGRTPAGRRPA